MAASSKFNQMTSLEVNRDRHPADNRGRPTFQRRPGLVTTDFGWIDSGIESGKSEQDYYVINRGRFHRGGNPSTRSTAIGSEYPRFADLTDHPSDPRSICECFSTTGDSEILAIVEPNGKTTKLRIITDDEEDPYESCADKFLSKLKLGVETRPKVVEAIKEAISKLMLTLSRDEAIRNDEDIKKDDEEEGKEDQEKDVNEKFENFYEVLRSASESTSNGDYAVLENQYDRKKAAPVSCTIKRYCGRQQRRNKVDIKPAPRSSNVSQLAVMGSCDSINDAMEYGAASASFPAAKQTRNDPAPPPPMCCVFIPRSPSPENGAADSSSYQGKAFPVGKQSVKSYPGEERPIQDCSQSSMFYHRSGGKTELRNSKRIVKRDSVLWTHSSVVQVLGVF